MLAGCESSGDRAAESAARFDQLFAQRNFSDARIAIAQAIGLREDTAAYWIKLGEVESALRDPASAYGAYSRALELERANLDAKTNMAELALLAGLIDEAQLHAEQLLITQPDNLRAKLVLGSVLLRRNDHEGAIKAADELIAAAPSADGPYVLKARAQIAMQEPTAAIATLDGAVAMRGPSASIYETMLDLQRQMGDLPGMLASYDQLIKLDPKDVELQFARAEDLHDFGRTDEALARLTAIDKQHAGNPGIRARAIDQWLPSGGQPIADPELLRRAADAAPAVTVALARHAIDTRRAPIALKLLRGLGDQEKVDPVNLDAQILFATAENMIGKTNAARERIERVTAFDGSNPRALLLHGRIAEATMDYDTMLLDAQLLTRDSPGFADGWVMLAEAYLRRGETRLAVQTYQRASNALPEEIELHSRFTGLLMQQGEDERAIRVARELVDRDPASVGGWTLLADRCRQGGRKDCVKEAEQAIAELRTARPGAPQDGDRQEMARS